MTIAARAWMARQSSRRALRRGDLTTAVAAASDAQQLCATPTGRRLLGVLRWLHAVA